MLIKFADGHRATLDALRAAVVSGDGPTAARHAHTIAGSSGNLGADDLRAAARALERAAREGGNDLAPLLADLETRAAVVLRSIETLRGTNPPAATASPPLVPAESRTALERLKTALGDFDLSGASSALADLERIVMPDGTSQFARLRNLVDSYEYDEARVLATRLLEQIGSQVR
jgi:two-component system sensor histidine kinase/response regulator